RDVEQVAMKVLEDEREGRLTPVARAPQLGDGTGRWIEEVRAVVRLPIVVAGGAEEDRGQEDQEGGGGREPGQRDEWGVERREVSADLVVPALEGRPVRVADQGRQHEALDEWRNPPRVSPLGGGEARTPDLLRHDDHRPSSSAGGRRHHSAWAARA